MSQRADKDKHLGCRNSNSSCSDLFLPTSEAKEKLMQTIQEIEDVFIEYADQTIGRVVRDLEDQMQRASSVKKIRLKETSLKQKPKERSLFEVKESLQIAVSLLFNDIRNFAMLYKTFRDTHFEFFDLEDEQSELGHNGALDEQAVTDRVPCDPQLSKDFFLLELIDEFRYSGEAALLDKLMREVQESSSEASDEEVIHTYVQKRPDINVIEEEDAESDDA